jgi:hypothetical protein
MVLTLNHTQRLNLSALIGAQKTTVGDMRALWKLQDRLDLDEDEKRAINFRMETMNNVEFPAWDRAKTIPERGIEVSESEASRIRKILDEWPTFQVAPDRTWLANLLDQLGTTSNGAGG